MREELQHHHRLGQALRSRLVLRLQISRRGNNVGNRKVRRTIKNVLRVNGDVR